MLGNFFFFSLSLSFSLLGLCSELGWSGERKGGGGFREGKRGKEEERKGKFI